jgi:hypothetical protein
MTNPDQGVDQYLTPPRPTTAPGPEMILAGKGAVSPPRDRTLGHSTIPQRPLKLVMDC